MRKPGWRQGWAAVAGLCALLAAVELLLLARALRLPEGRLANVLADDAFYYLVLGKNFAAQGRWTFDGVEPASGFHLLWGYLVAAVYRAAPAVSLHGAYAAMELLSIACLCAAAAVSASTAVRMFGQGAVAGVAAVFLSALSLTTAQSMMESSLAVLFAALAVHAVVASPRAAGRELGWCLALGWLGVLARSDFLVLPVCLAAVALVGRMAAGTPRRRAAALLLGAVLGEGSVALHTHWVSGEWVQSSARQKLFWSSLQGYSATPARHLLLTFLDLGSFQPWSAWLNRWGPRASTCFLLLLLAGGLWQGWRRQERGAVLLLAGAVATLAGYLLLYRFNSAEMQNWYSASFQVPLALLAGGVAAGCWTRYRAATAAVAGVFCLAGVLASFRPVPLQASALYEAGLYLRQHPELRPAGAWNAGQIAYFAGGGVTNLDGLVNDRIHRYAVDDRLLDYVRARGLRTLIDSPLMLDPAVMRADGEPTTARRGGYSDGRLQGCVTATPVPRPDAATGAGGAKLYRVRQPCGR